MIERGLQQVHLRLEQIALRLRDEKARGEPHLVSPLLDVEALARHARAGPRCLYALCRALHLANRLTKRLCDFELQAGDPLGGLPSLNLSSREPSLFETAPQRIIYGEANAPRRIGAVEHLPQHAAIASARRSDDGAWKLSRPKKPCTSETAAPI